MKVRRAKARTIGTPRRKVKSSSEEGERGAEEGGGEMMAQW